MDINGRLTGFSVEQRKWVMARILATSDAEAARAVGVHPATVCRWPNKPELDAVVDDLLMDTAKQALNIILDAVPEAAAVKVAALKSRKENIKQSAASEILDRALGKSVQRQDVSVSGSVTMQVVEEIVDAAGQDTAIHNAGAVSPE